MFEKFTSIGLAVAPRQHGCYHVSNAPSWVSANILLWGRKKDSAVSDPAPVLALKTCTAMLRCLKN